METKEIKEKKPKKEKKPLTATQTKNKYRALQWTCFGSEIRSRARPYVGIRALMGLTVWSIGKKKDDQSERTSGLLTLALGWAAIGFVFFMLSSILGDIAMIMLCGSLGIFGALGLNVASVSFKKKADMYQEAINEVTKDGVKDKAKEEAMAKAKEEYHPVD